MNIGNFTSIVYFTDFMNIIHPMNIGNFTNICNFTNADLIIVRKMPI